jgi:hypothetical protein
MRAWTIELIWFFILVLGTYEVVGHNKSHGGFVQCILVWDHTA